MRNRLLCSALVACAALAPTGAIPAHADADARQVASTLLFTIASGETPPQTGKTAVLGCEPAGGTHPHAQEACEELGKVDGDFDALSVDPKRVCPLVYDPVTVTAEGWWHGRMVQYAKTYGNVCQLEGTTGPVFQF
jgi:hypothetical protein